MKSSDQPRIIFILFLMKLKIYDRQDILSQIHSIRHSILTGKLGAILILASYSKW